MTGAGFRAELAVSPETAAVARKTVREAVGGVDGDAALSYAVQLMVTEVVHGLVQHGHPSQLVLEGSARGGDLLVTVTALDSGPVTDLFAADYVGELLSAMTEDVWLEVDADRRTVQAQLRFESRPTI